MHSRKNARSEDGRESPESRETVALKVARRNLTQGDAKNPKTGSKWPKSVLEKWRGALVKARLALRKKREKKKEQHVKSTLARLRKIADAARKPQEEDKVLQKPPLLKKRGRPPLVARVGKAQVLAAVATERTSTKILKKSKITSGRSQADDGDLKEPIISVTKVKRGRKPSASTTTNLDEADVAKFRAEMKRKEEMRNKWRNALEIAPIISVTKVKRGRKPSASTSTNLDEADVAKLRAEMERKEEIRNKWRNALEIARSALQQKRERRKEQAQMAAIRRRRRSQDGAVQDNVTQVVFSLKRPSLEELRNFAKKLRS